MRGPLSMICTCVLCVSRSHGGIIRLPFRCSPLLCLAANPMHEPRALRQQESLRSGQLACGREGYYLTV